MVQGVQARLSKRPTNTRQIRRHVQNVLPIRQRGGVLRSRLQDLRHGQERLYRFQRVPSGYRRDVERYSRGEAQVGLPHVRRRRQRSHRYPGDDEDRTGHLRHVRRLLVQQTGGLGRGEGEEHLRENGREQRRSADAGRVPEGLPAGRGAVQDARALMRFGCRGSRHVSITQTKTKVTMHLLKQNKKVISPSRYTCLHIPRIELLVRDRF